MKPRWRTAILLLGVATAPLTARADCTWSDLVRDDIAIAVVQSPAARIFFVKDEQVQGCPNVDVACVSPAYLTPGDVVLTGSSQGRYTCAGFMGTRGTTTIGWLPSAALAPASDGERRPTDWTGHWVAPEQDLTITGSGSFSVKGDATWGMRDPERRRRGGVHIGEVTGTARPVAGVLAFTTDEDGKTLPYDAGDEFSCRVRLLRRGPYLVVRDNNACGGVNVTFSGFYRRKD